MNSTPSSVGSFSQLEEKFPITLESYTRSKILCSGAYGDIEIATVNSPGPHMSQTVVLKWSKTPLENDTHGKRIDLVTRAHQQQENCKSLMREFTILNALKTEECPYIVNLLGAITLPNTNQKCNIYERMDGCLHSLIQKDGPPDRMGKTRKIIDPLPVDHILNLIQQCFQGVAFLKKHQMIHADIKPSNILYQQRSDFPLNLRFCLADFGSSSKKGESAIYPTSTTLWWRAPEVVLHAPFCDLRSPSPEIESLLKKYHSYLTSAIDYWALGIVFTEVYTGYIPTRVPPNSFIQEHIDLAKCLVTTYGPFDQKEFETSYLGQHLTHTKKDISTYITPTTDRQKVVEAIYEKREQAIFPLPRHKGIEALIQELTILDPSKRNLEPEKHPIFNCQESAAATCSISSTILSDEDELTETLP